MLVEREKHTFFTHKRFQILSKDSEMTTGSMKGFKLP
jgi:hypothetical protein